MFSGLQKFSSEFCNLDYETSSGFISFADEPYGTQQKGTCDTPSSIKRVLSEHDSSDEQPERKTKSRKMFLSLETTTVDLPACSGGDPTNEISLASSISNPVTIVESLYSDCRFEINSADTDQSLSAVYNVLLSVANKTFNGVGHSKKSAKMEASRAALSSLFNLECYDDRLLQRCRDSTNNSTDLNHHDTIPCYKSDPNTDQMLILSQCVAQDIGQTMMEANIAIFESLADTNKWSVLSGILLTSTQDPLWSNMISLTTGNKCIKGDSISMLGASLNDCHAEILSRRCFLVYLYEQITQLILNERNNDLTLKHDSENIILDRCANRPGYRLKPHIEINMFISSNPCGDARISDGKNEVSQHESCGLLRTKSESDENTPPVKNDNHPSWRAIIHGEQQFRVMSCSDKLALWNIVGLQGSLLSNFLEPIYLNSLTIGSSIDLHDIHRAISTRMNLTYDSPSIKQLPRSYRLNIPRLGSCTMSISRTRITEGIHSPSYSINHIKNKPPEVVCTTTGKVVDGTSSRLSKMAMLRRFINLLDMKPSILQDSLLIAQDGSQTCPKIYRQAKTASRSYQLAKNKSLNAFAAQNLGKWLSAPCEVDLFKLNQNYFEKCLLIPCMLDTINAIHQ